MAEKRKLLVADDEEMIREAVASYLESQGYQVFRAENGEEALNILKREPISLVILDLMLPDLPGEEVCVRIRKQSRVPIIMPFRPNFFFFTRDRKNGKRPGAAAAASARPWFSR